ncbi:MAG: TrmH family RNA methyltransferase [Pseudomonadota bacterium]
MIRTDGTKSASRGADQPATVLAYPQLGENIGMAARAMANGGLHQLRLVKPRDGWPDAKAISASAGALDGRVIATCYQTQPQALGDRHLIFAFSARQRAMQLRWLDPAEAVLRAMQAVQARQRVAFLFGCERSGLDNEAIAMAHYGVAIPTCEGFASLNLAHAVMVLCYEWQKQWASRHPTEVMSEPLIAKADHEPAETRAIDLFITRLDQTLLRCGFYKSLAMRPVVRRNIRNFFKRAQPMRYELQTLHGMVQSLSHRKNAVQGQEPDQDSRYEPER